MTRLHQSSERFRTVPKHNSKATQQGDCHAASGSKPGPKALRTRHQPKFLGTSQFERKMRVLLPHQRDWDMVLTSSILGKFMSSLSDIMNHVLCIATGYGEKGGHKNGCLGIVRPKIWPESTCVFQNGAACFVAGCILNLLSEVFKLIIFLAFLIIVPWFLGTLRFHLSPCLPPVIEDPLVTLVI